MLRLNRICAMLLAVGAMAVMSIPVMADDDLVTDRTASASEAEDNLDTDITVPASEAEEYGNTTLSIFQARQDPKNVSFTVPLYVTMAVVEGEPVVQTPNNYAITNTSQPESPDPSAPKPFSISVVRMDFTKMAGSSYNTVEKESDLTNGRDILFRIGHLPMPALSEPGTRPVNLRQEGSQFLADPGNIGPESPLKEIAAYPGTDPHAPQNVLALDLDGKVPATLRLEDAPSVAQFQVKYILSVLDGQGNPLGNVYAGDDRTVAGLPPIEPGD